MGYSPWGHKESDTTERLHFHFHFPFQRMPSLVLGDLTRSRTDVTGTIPWPLAGDPDLSPVTVGPGRRLISS